ncbi:MAG: geranylgeranyl reductase family protein [Promethearchaeota archaeon]
MYDVVISGSGPAGSKCAEIIAKSGFKVALLEKNSTWRKPCGGAVSSRVFKYYPQLRKLNFLPITGISLYSSDFIQLDYSWEEIREPSMTVDRLKFDTLIRDIAVDAGAELFDKNYSYDFVYKKNNKIGIKTRTPKGPNEFFGKILIIADGMSSKLAIKSGLREKWKIDEIGLAKCAILEGKNTIDPSRISLFFKKYKGYGWIFPLDETHFNIGCGTWLEANQHINLNQAYQEFLNEPFLKKFFPNKNYKVIWEGAYPLPALGVKGKSLFGENLMIIGDAAGFVSPISGEGIHASIVSGYAAGNTAIEALTDDNISQQTLKKYKSYPNIRKMRRNFKMTASMVDFFYENEGINLSNMFKLAASDQQLREMTINMFLFSLPPSTEYHSRLKAMR